MFAFAKEDWTVVTSFADCLLKGYNRTDLSVWDCAPDSKEAVYESISSTES